MKNNLLKKALPVGMLACSFLALAACGSSEDGADQPSPSVANTPTAAASTPSPSPSPAGLGTVIDKPVEIEFWHAMTGNHEKALAKITDDFNAKSEFVTVKLVGQGSYNDLSQKLMAAAKAKTSPALSQVYEDWVTEYIRNDLVAELTPFIDDAQVGWSKDELDDIIEVFREANQWDGKYYSLPFNKSTRVLFYNKGLFEEHGVKVPANWDELKDAAQKLTLDTDGDGKANIVGMGFENSVTDEFSTFVMQAGGQYIDEQELKVKINSPEGLSALNLINGMLEEGIARLAGEDGYMSNPFGRGDVAMYIGSSAGIPFVAEAAQGNIDFAVSVLPAGKKAATPFAGTSVAVFKSSSDVQQLAAWEYIKHLINTENTAYWAQESGYLPVRYSALQLASYVAFKEANPAQGVGELQFDAGFYSPKVVGASAVRSAVSSELEAVLAGQKTVEQGLADAETKGNAELEKANAR